MVESIAKHLYAPRQATYKTWRRMKRLLQAYSLALKEEEMEIQPTPGMSSYQSNKTAELQQQIPIEEKSTTGDPSSIDMPTTNN